jgi:hypothetical protein
MSATIHELFANAGPHKPASAQAPAAAHTSVEALKSATVPLLVEQLLNAFQAADDTLFEMSERAMSDADRRSYFDAMRALRLQQASILHDFERECAAGFHPSPRAETREADQLDIDTLTIQSSDELEVRIALGNLAARADSLHRNVLWELGRRLEHMRKALRVPISDRALSPQHVCEAFRLATDDLDLELRVRLVLYKLFERLTVGGLHQVYITALQVLDLHGIRPPPSAARVPAASASPSAAVEPAALRPAGAVSSEETNRAPPAPEIDPLTLRALQQLSSALIGFRPAEGQPATPTFGMPAGGYTALAPSQRLSLVGQMCNEILGDPYIPESVRPVLEQLRLPLIKVALSDNSFFHDRGHPVRRLLAEAAEAGASTRASSGAMARRLAERLREIAQQIDLEAGANPPREADLAPLEMADIAAFLDQQREEAAARRQTVLSKLRRTVSQELEVHTLGRRLPAALTPFLRSGWGTLMALRLLKFGMGSEEWNDAVDCLSKLLTSMDKDEAGAEQRQARPGIIESLRRRLAEIGLRDDKLRELMRHLRAAYAELDGKAIEEETEPELPVAEPAPPAPAVSQAPTETAAIGKEDGPPTSAIDQALLQRCLIPDSWFRVYHAAKAHTLWLKVSQYYPEHDSVGFTGFDAGRNLSVRIPALIQDLLARRSEPVNPHADAQAALAELLARHRNAAR